MREHNSFDKKFYNRIVANTKKDISTLNFTK